MSSDATAADPASAFPPMDVRVSHLLYELLSGLHELLTEAGITYWLDGGTALGCARHGGIIPWDDDADVSVFECDRPRLAALVERVHRHCEPSNEVAAVTPTPAPASPCPLSRLQFMPTFFGWKLCDRSSPLIPGHPWRYPSVDVFFVRLPSPSPPMPTPALQRLTFAAERAQKCWGAMNWYAHEILLPPQPDPAAAAAPDDAPPSDEADAADAHADSDSDSDSAAASSPSAGLSYSPARTSLLLQAFGELRLYAPALASLTAYLTRSYGADWSSVAYRTFDHARERKHDPATRRVRVELTPQDRQPARTHGPLASVKCTCKLA